MQHNELVHDICSQWVIYVGKVLGYYEGTNEPAVLTASLLFMKNYDQLYFDGLCVAAFTKDLQDRAFAAETFSAMVRS